MKFMIVLLRKSKVILFLYVLCQLPDETSSVAPYHGTGMGQVEQDAGEYFSLHNHLSKFGVVPGTRTCAISQIKSNESNWCFKMTISFF